MFRHAYFHNRATRLVNTRSLKGKCHLISEEKRSTEIFSNIAMSLLSQWVSDIVTSRAQSWGDNCSVLNFEARPRAQNLFLKGCAVFSKLKAIFPRALSKLDNLKTEADAISSPFSNTFQWYITANCFHPCNALAFNISLKSMWDWKKETNIPGAIFHFLVAFYHKNLSVLCLAQGDTSNLESTLIFWCFVPSKLKLSHFCKNSENCFGWKLFTKHTHVE